ncbi:MAG: hypothetical protein NZ874_00470 [Fimbriimonadales bacterium]|nr:hypothetical protein [Fimbriimonadales bacterium]
MKRLALWLVWLIAITMLAKGIQTQVGSASAQKDNVCTTYMC